MPNWFSTMPRQPRRTANFRCTVLYARQVAEVVNLGRRRHQVEKIVQVLVWVISEMAD
jgi:hypothetical protein